MLLSSRLQILRNRNFALFWAGQGTSWLGDGLFNIAVLWQTLQLTGSSLSVAIVAACLSIPYLALSLFGGVLADRYDRRKILVISDATSMAVTFGFAWLLLAGYPMRAEYIYGLALAYGTVRAFFSPASSAILPTIVGKEMIVNANGLLIATQQLANVFGPALGGGLLAFAGIGMAALLNGLTFGISALCMLLVRLAISPQATSGRPRASVLDDIRTGLSYVYQDRILLILIVMFLMTNFAGSPLSALLPTYVSSLGAGAGTLGVFEASFASGMVLGSLPLSFLKQKDGQERKQLLMSIFAGGLGLALLALLNSAWAAAGLLFLIGMTNAILHVTARSLFQSTVPEALMGRVFSIIGLTIQALYPVGLTLSGVLADATNVGLVFVAGGLLMAGTAGVGAFFWQGLDHMKSQSLDR